MNQKGNAVGWTITGFLSFFIHLAGVGFRGLIQQEFTDFLYYAGVVLSVISLIGIYRLRESGFKAWWMSVGAIPALLTAAIFVLVIFGFVMRFLRSLS